MKLPPVYATAGLKSVVVQHAGWWWAIRPGTTYRHPLGRPHHDWQAAMNHALREDHL